MAAPSSAAPDGPVHILVVEDDPDQIALLHVLARRCSIPVRMHVAENGYEALEYLWGAVGTGARGEAQLVLLDLDLPELDGRKVLSEMRADPTLAKVPVVIVSASEATADVKHAFEHQASGFLRKPIEAEDLEAMLRQVVHRAVRWS